MRARHIRSGPERSTFQAGGLRLAGDQVGILHRLARGALAQVIELVVSLLRVIAEATSSQFSQRGKIGCLPERQDLLHEVAICRSGLARDDPEDGLGGEMPSRGRGVMVEVIRILHSDPETIRELERDLSESLKDANAHNEWYYDCPQVRAAIEELDRLYPGRKLRTHSAWDMIRLFGLLLVQGPKLFRSRDQLSFWYGERRHD